MTGLSPQRSRLLALAREAGDRHFDPATGRCLIVRDTCWYAIALLFDAEPERRAFGQGLLARARSEDPTHTPATFLAILHCIGEKLEGPTAAHLEQEVDRLLVEATEHQWRDGNVNHPLAAYATLILGGERCAAPWASAIGLRRLVEFRERIGEHRSRYRRQAELSEYNSPTYTALSIWWLALLAEFAKDDRARHLARFLEERLWLDVAMHFHAPSQQFAGPHSRAYLDDSVGGYSALHCTMSAAFGEGLMLEPAVAERFHHVSALVENALVAILPYHVPDEARRMAWEKPFPYSFRKTTYAERYHENSRRWTPTSDAEHRARLHGDGSAGEEPLSAGGSPFAFDDEVYPGGWSELVTHMTTEYALGSATRPYVNAGHAESFMLRIRRNDRIGGASDIRSAFVRGVFNDARIGERNQCHVLHAPVDESYLYEEGRSAFFQHEGRIIGSSSPKRAGHLGVREYRLDLFFTWPAPFDELLLDDRPVERFPFECAPGTRILFRDHRTFGSLLPLAPVPAPSPTPIRLWRSAEFLVVSMTNHRGPARDLSRHEINLWRTGFAMELMTADEISWEEFRLRARAASVGETIREGLRHLRFTSPGGTLEGLYDPFREEILGQWWNGEREGTDHLSVSAPARSGEEFSPTTLFGREAIR